MKTIEEIYTEYNEDDYLNEEWVKDFYERYGSIIESTDTFDTKTELDHYIFLTTGNMQTLFDHGNYEKALKICERNISIIEKHTDVLSIKPDHRYLTSNLFYKSRILYLTKRVNEAIKTLEQLVLIEPDNDMYSLNIEIYKLSKVHKFSNVLTTIGILTLALLTVFGDSLLDANNRMIISILTLIFITVGYSLPYLVKKKINDLKK